MPNSDKSELESMYSGHDTLALIRVMNEYRRRKEEQEEKLKQINAHYDFLRYIMIPQRFDDEGIKNLSVDGVGRINLSSGVYVSIPQEKRPEAYEYLRDTGHGDVISTTINAQTLAATVKSMIAKGEEIPDELFVVTPWTRAAITKG
jgi:hypothetical protein